jgi:hypothetical protein
MLPMRLANRGDRAEHRIAFSQPPQQDIIDFEHDAMTLRIIVWTLDAAAAITVAVALPAIFAGTEPSHSAVTDKLGVNGTRVVGVFLGALLYASFKWAVLGLFSNKSRKEESIYGLQHGRLHLQVPTPMWMNMGYWDTEAPKSKTMAEACRDLLKVVLGEAGFSGEIDNAEMRTGTRRRKLLIDLGFGCGDQTVYLMSTTPVRSSDHDWWDEREPCGRFDHYVGITQDAVQARYASERVGELKASPVSLPRSDDDEEYQRPITSVFCGDAAKPESWSTQIQDSIERASPEESERWVLALDTAYHFSPSRWPVIRNAHTQLHASFMAFDLCLSPTATVTQKLVLRVLTTFMGAPWVNFVTPDEYRGKLVETGYAKGAIKIVDVSEHVFAPLAQYLDAQDARLKTLGLGIGSFNVAKSLFGWWGRSGVVRGVVVVAKR